MNIHSTFDNKTKKKWSDNYKYNIHRFVQFSNLNNTQEGFFLFVFLFKSKVHTLICNNYNKSSTVYSWGEC